MTGSIIGFCCTKPKRAPPISTVEGRNSPFLEKMVYFPVTKDLDHLLLPIPYEFHSDDDEKKGYSRFPQT